MLWYRYPMDLSSFSIIYGSLRVSMLVQDPITLMIPRREPSVLILVLTLPSRYTAYNLRTLFKSYTGRAIYILLLEGSRDCK